MIEQQIYNIEMITDMKIGLMDGWGKKQIELMIDTMVDQFYNIKR